MTTKSDSGLTGIAVSLPYGDSDYYKNMKKIFTNIGLDSTYIEWVGKFVSASGSANSYDHDDWDDSWDGWDEYDDDYDDDYFDDYYDDDDDWWFW